LQEEQEEGRRRIRQRGDDVKLILSHNISDFDKINCFKKTCRKKDHDSFPEAFLNIK